MAHHIRPFAAVPPIVYQRERGEYHHRSAEIVASFPVNVGRRVSIQPVASVCAGHPGQPIDLSTDAVAVPDDVVDLRERGRLLALTEQVAAQRPDDVEVGGFLAQPPQTVAATICGSPEQDIASLHDRPSERPT